ncbi:MAG: PA0069 family radical SAM protein [Verrucomicrobiota bacterium]
MPFHLSPRGRGTTLSPGNRFEKEHLDSDDAAWEEISQVDPDFEPRQISTQTLEDQSQSILSKNDSPDIGFTYSINPYRGCEHGCSYCYARPYHEYLGLNAGIDFESRILVKSRAPELLEEALAKPSWQPTSLACSGVTDCYQPVERERKITRSCLQVLRDFRNPVGIITKNALVTRDIDLLSELAGFGASLVAISLTTLDAELAGKLEPRASRPAARLEAMRKLSEAGIPVSVSVAPIIPGLNDHELPAILQAAADHGARFASGTVLRLPHCVSDLFTHWLEEHFPDRKELILGRIRELRGGRLNESEFGTRMTGSGPLAAQIQQLIRVSRQRAGLAGTRPSLNTTAFRRRLPGQLELFS